MKLYLVRHATAEDVNSAIDDQDRALTEAGKAKMLRAVEGLRKIKVRPVLILTSPLKRARETAEILAGGLPEARVEVMAELVPGVDSSTILEALRPYVRHKSVALVGHQPGLGKLASLLLTGSEGRCDLDFKKGGVACLEGEFSDDPTRCVLEWFAAPRLLRRL
jgi:phosphohistidine phosphatase